MSAIDVFKSCFPAGTVSGAPKIMAMKIIDENEPVRRGVYAGAIGWISTDGDMDTCIAIRTAVISEGKVFVQAGGGIVQDSVPELEFMETIHKSGSIMQAVHISEKIMEGK
jgi:anthranilate synthase component 1